MLDQLTVLTFSLYLLTMLSIGVIGYKFTKNLSDYILGGRSLGSVVTALSAGASDMSAWLLMGFPGAVYALGLSESWIAIGLVIGAWLNWRFVAAKLRVLTEKYGNSNTLPEYFANRFNDKSHVLRLVSSVIILVFFTLYCASGVAASAKLFNNMFAIPYTQALFLGSFATILYVFLGGFLAVSWTDTVQSTLMILALLFVPIAVFANLGVSETWQLIASVKPDHLRMYEHWDTVAIFSLLAWGLGYFGQPHILVRFMAAKSDKIMVNARRIGMTWMIICLLCAVFIGLVGVAYFNAYPAAIGAVATDREMVFVELSKALFHPGILGFLLAAIIAASMSTLSCQLLMCSSTLTQDFYSQFVNVKAHQKQLVWIGRFMVLLIAALAIWLARDPNNRILSMVSYAWAGFGAAFGPLILLSLYWKGTTKYGALAGMIVGSAVVILWKQKMLGFIPDDWYKWYEIVPGFILSMLVIIVVSMLTPKPFLHNN